MEVVAFDPAGLADDDAGCIVEAKFLRPVASSTSTLGWGAWAESITRSGLREPSVF
jgi:hypothetical protein